MFETEKPNYYRFIRLPIVQAFFCFQMVVLGMWFVLW